MPKVSSDKGPSRHIPHDQQRLLWVRAGGRCEFCNKYLLEDLSTIETLNLAELAHNVGHKDSKGSPRGEDALPLEERNNADNILLLCRDDHRSIDAKVNRGVYTVEYLQGLKEAHERRIRYVTGLAEDAETVVLRVVGDIRGGAVELSEQTAARGVLRAGRRYPRFGWGFGGADFEVDLRGLPAEGSELYWQVGRERIQEQLTTRLAEAVARDQVRHLSVFGLARIPLLACVGEQLDDKVPTDLFQKQRSDGEGWGWDDAAAPVTFAVEPVRDGADDEVAILVGISASLSVSDLPNEFETATVWAISPREQDPSRDIMRARASLDNFSRAYHDCIGRIESARPKPEAIHLFPAVPATAAIALGRGMMRDAQPALRVYDRVQPDAPFEFALELNS